MVLGLLIIGCAQVKKETATPTPTLGFKLVKPGVLTVRMDATYPPFEYINETTKKFEGFDVDLMRATAKKLGLKVEFKNVAWEGIIPGFVTHQYDCICSAMTITKEREKQVDFSDPYFIASQRQQNSRCKGFGWEGRRSLAWNYGRLLRRKTSQGGYSLHTQEV